MGHPFIGTDKSHWHHTIVLHAPTRFLWNELFIYINSLKGGCKSSSGTKRFVDYKQITIVFAIVGEQHLWQIEEENEASYLWEVVEDPFSDD